MVGGIVELIFSSFFSLLKSAAQLGLVARFLAEMESSHGQKSSRVDPKVDFVTKVCKKGIPDCDFDL